MNRRGAISIEAVLWAVGAAATAVAYAHATFLPRDEAMIRAGYRDRQVESMMSTMNQRFDDQEKQLSRIYEKLNRVR